MFSSIGWLEILVIVLLGLVIIGPERLPGVIMDVRAAVYAARKAINNAKAELSGEMTGLGAEFDDLRVPLSQAAQWSRLGPRGVITKALFDGDDSAWDDFNPKKMAEDIKHSTDPSLRDAASPVTQPGQRPQQTGAPAPHPTQQPQQAQPGQHVQVNPHEQQGRPTFDYSQIYADPHVGAAAPAQDAEQAHSQDAAQASEETAGRLAGRSAGNTQPPRGGSASTGGGSFSWEDVT